MSQETPRHELIWPKAGIRMAFRLIPKGTFRMGSRGGGHDEEPTHRVQIEDDFWLGETVVTQAQFALWTKAEGIEHENEFPGRPNHPAQNLSWRQAVQFCARLTKTQSHQFPDGFDLACLPTEAEWEYACRAGSSTDYYNGDGPDSLAEVGWFGGDWEGGPHAVDEKSESHPYGLRGMHGNVCEWCHDLWDEHAYRELLSGDLDAGGWRRAADHGAGTATMLKSDRYRVLRGGSWNFSAGNCRSAFRYWGGPDDRGRRVGFRVCLVRGPKSKNRTVSTGAQAEPGRGDGAARHEPAESDRPGGAGAPVREHAEPPPRSRASRWIRTIATSVSRVLPFSSAETAQKDPGVINALSAVPEWRRYDNRVRQIVLGQLGDDDDGQRLRVTELPSDLAQRFPNLSHLYLWNLDGLSRLPELPRGLECLDVRGCRDLAELPRLPESLETLDVGGCLKFSRFPTGTLPKLGWLYFNGCTGLKSHHLATFLESLEDSPVVEIDGSETASFTTLEVLPRARLERLVLKGCEALTDLRTIAQFPVLEHLNLSGCTGVKELPGLPPKLRYLILRGAENLTRFMAQDVGPYDRGLEEDQNVARAFISRRKFGSELAIMPHAKVLLLGDGRVGKTTLAKCLHWEALGEEGRKLPANAALKPSRDEPFAHGIRFAQWRAGLSLPKKESEELEQRLSAAGKKVPRTADGELEGTMRLWDFGGQELYHATHRVFASEGSIFLVVWCEHPPAAGSKPPDVTDDEWSAWNEQRSLDYWLDYVYGLRPASEGPPQVALVCTRCPNADTTATKPDWKARAPRNRSRNLPCFYVDSLDEQCGQSAGFKELTSWIREACGREAQRIGIVQLRFYRLVSDLLDEWLTRNSSARDHGQTSEHLLCEWSGWTTAIQQAYQREFPETGIQLEDRDINAITDYLHQAGHLYRIRDAEHPAVLVDQAWAAEGIYRLLEPSGDLRRRVKANGGWFYKSALEADPVWRSLGDQAQRMRLLEYMRECRIVTLISEAARNQANQDVLLASEKWLLPTHEAVENRLADQWDLLKRRAGVEVHEAFEFENVDLDEAEFRSLQSFLARTFGTRATYFRTGFQAIDDQQVPGWAFRLRWGLKSIPAEDEAGKKSGKQVGRLDGLLLASREQIHFIEQQIEELFGAEGSPLARKDRTFKRRESARSDLEREYYCGIRDFEKDVAVSSNGEDQEEVEAMIKVLEAAGHSVHWYRKPECRLDDRAGVMRFMHSLRKQRSILLVLSPAYLRPDPENNWYCAWELADAILELADGRRSPDATLVMLKKGDGLDSKNVHEKIQGTFEEMGEHFARRYDEKGFRDRQNYTHYDDLTKLFARALEGSKIGRFYEVRGTLGEYLRMPENVHQPRAFDDVIKAVKKALKK